MSSQLQLVFPENVSNESSLSELQRAFWGAVVSLMEFARPAAGQLLSTWSACRVCARGSIVFSNPMVAGRCGTAESRWLLMHARGLVPLMI